MDVGVRELKQHLSEYLDRAAGGEIITVTERGHPKVMLVPLPGGGDRLARGIDEGWITPPRRHATLAPAKRVAGGARVADVIDDDRGD
ncbi:MAG TPA: type II toxin-antitoxin system prevent-host-death family antitoxin [Ilumatobacteraceae bacterium]|jgi:prevent-host-death family protein